MDNLTVFVAITTVAIVIQMGVLIAMFLSMRKTSARMEAIANEVQSKALPLLDNATQMLAENRERIETITTNLASASTTARNQIERLDMTISDVLDRTRLQVIRVDDMVTRTMDKVEETSDIVQHTVISPVRQISALAQGLSAGVAAFFGGRRQQREGERQVTQDEEMFI